MTSLDAWLRYLETLHPRTMELGLERVTRVAGRLPEIAAMREHCRVVTVAGTNGKGSSIAILEALGLAADRRVGAYTSPHLLRYNERIRVDAEPVSDAAILTAFQRIEAVRGETSLSYFEFATLAALLVFAEARPDLVLLEVGLGGRLDAVNLLDPDLAVITNVDLDHQQWLGEDRETIGAEKAGVLRPGVPAVCADPQPPHSLLARARELGADLRLVDRHWHWRAGAGDWQWSGETARGGPSTLMALPLPALPLPSVAAALQGFLLLGENLPRERVARVLRQATLPGRCQRLLWRERQVVLDVGHNPAAARYLAERLGPANGRRVAVLAAMADKDVRGIVAALSSRVDEWLCAGLPGLDRAAAPVALRETVASLGGAGCACDNVSAAFHRALAASQPGDEVVVLGSFHTVAAAVELLRSDCQGNAD